MMAKRRVGLSRKRISVPISAAQQEDQLTSDNRAADMQIVPHGYMGNEIIVAPGRISKRPRKARKKVGEDDDDMLYEASEAVPKKASTRRLTVNQQLANAGLGITVCSAVSAIFLNLGKRKLHQCKHCADQLLSRFPG